VPVKARAGLTKAGVRLLLSPALFSFFRRIAKMHVGKVYRTVFRRDWPTDRPYPCLWPFRLWCNFCSGLLEPLYYFGSFSIAPFSSIGVTNDDESRLFYEISTDSAPIDQTMRLDIFPGDDLRPRYELKFTSPDRVGYMLLADRLPVVEDGSGAFTLRLMTNTPDLIIIGTGDFIGWDPAPFMQTWFQYVAWDELPTDEQNPD